MNNVKNKIIFLFLFTGFFVGFTTFLFAAVHNTIKPIFVRGPKPDPALIDVMKKAGFQFVGGPPNSEKNWNAISKYNLWLILDWSPGNVNKESLHKFLESGGGVFISIWGSDIINNEYPAWNALLGPYGMTVKREQVRDRNHNWIEPVWGLNFAWTNNFVNSPITKGLGPVWYPNNTLNRQGLKVGNSLLLFNKKWTAVVRTMPSGGAYKLKANGAPDYNRMTESEPAILAIRQVGLGRIAVQSFPAFYNYTGGSTKMVGEVTLTKGNGKILSDGAQLLVNTFKWLAEPSLRADTLGNWKPTKKLLPQKRWPGPAITQKQWELRRPRVKNYFESYTTKPFKKMYHFKGLLGAHTSLSSGSGTVAEQCKIAQAAGYDFIIFTENLSQMNAEKYARLVAECKSASSNSFVAIPGLDVQVRPWGNSKARPWNYLIFNFKKFPDKHYLSQDGKYFKHFDNWYYSTPTAGVAVYFPNKGGLPGWFYAFYNCFSVFTYKGGDLIDNAESSFQRVVDNGANLYPVVTHLCYSAKDIKSAAQTPFQFYVNEPAGKHDTSAEYGTKLMAAATSLQFGENMSAGFRNPQPSFVSSGPMLDEYSMVGGYPFDLMHNDRFRVVAGVSSTHGIKEISFFDGNSLYARFSPTPWKTTTYVRAEVRGYIGKYYHFIVKAEDFAGGKMISSMIKTGSWFIWAQMCTDQQNLIVGNDLYFKGISTLVRVPYAPVNSVRFWAGEGDDGPNLGDWNSGLAGDIAENGKGPLKDIWDYAPPEFHLDMASPSVVIVDANQRWNGFPEQESMMPADPLHLNLRIFNFWPAVPVPTGSFQKNFPEYQALHPPQVNWVLIKGEAEVTRDVDPNKKTFVNLRILGVVSNDFPQQTCAYLGKGTGHVIKIEEPASGWNTSAMLAKNGFMIISPIMTGSFAVYPLTSGLCFSLYKRNSYSWGLAIGYHLNGAVKKGTRFPVRFILARGLPGNTFTEDLTNFKKFGRQFGIMSPSPFYRMKPLQGKVLSTKGILELKASGYGFLGRLTGADKVREVVGVSITGLNSNWDAAVYIPDRKYLHSVVPAGTYFDKRYKWLRRISFYSGTGYTSLDQTEPSATFYIGNLLVCNNQNINLQLINSNADWYRFTAHNSGYAPVTITVRPAPGFQKVYPIPALSKTVTVPAGSTVTCYVGKSPDSKP